MKKLLDIENILSEVLFDLTNLTEENFIDNFNSAKSKMEILRKERVKNGSKIEILMKTKKNSHLAKLIKKKYDNIIKEWAEKLKLVKKEIELTQNQKKISIYSR